MPTTTSRQLEQPQLTLVLEYHLLQNGRKHRTASLKRFGKTPELSDFYEEDIL
jgi:hypothetical protein